MRTRRPPTAEPRRATRSTCVRGAVAALALAMLTVSAGCDSRISETLWQGAYTIFEDGMSAAITRIGSDVTTGIQDFDLPGTTTTGQTTEASTPGAGG